MLDLYGPLEMFAMRPDAFEIATVAERAGPVPAANGPATVAEAGFADLAYVDILLVPGGPGTRGEVENEVLLAWLRDTGARAEILASVCTGAVLLAAAGHLDGRAATTNKRAFAWVAGTRSAVDWRPAARWIETDKVFTASGVSAGMDMALALMARLLGREAARQAAHEAEYIWNDDPGADPFATDWKERRDER
ncbi:DJ-1/PfpI family protein [Roseovarius sp. SCSIO 43702]|nr:DJ-1/PfpI family protein [Roseovarius sp. SCSIO 43702]